MTARVDCGCGHVFEVDDGLVGGIASCPRCRHAVEVPGLDDPAWRLLQVVALALVAGGGVLAWGLGGPAWAALTVLGLGALLWLVSRAF